MQIKLPADEIYYLPETSRQVGEAGKNTAMVVYKPNLTGFRRYRPATPGFFDRIIHGIFSR